MSPSRTYKASILGSSKVLIRLSGIITAAVLARLLTKVDYAAYRQTILAFHFVEPLLIVGLSQTLIYFIPRDRKHSRSILTGNLLMLFGMGCVFALAMWMGGNELLAARFGNPVLKNLLLVYSPYGMLALPLSTVSACLIACDRVKSLAIYEVVSRIVGVIMVVVFVLTWGTPTAAVVGILAGTAIMVFPGLRLMYRATSAGSWLPSLNNIKEQLKFGIPLGLSSLIGIISINLDKLLVSSIFNPEQFAIYVNGAIEVPVVGIITGSVISILIPEFVEHYKMKDYGNAIALWQRAMSKCAFILFPIMVFLMIFAPEVMTIVFSQRYRASYLPFRIYLLLIPVRITNFGALIMAAGKSRYILYKSLGSLLINLVLSLMLIRPMGAIGAAVGTVMTVYLWNLIFVIIVISKLYHSRPLKIIPWSQLGNIAIIAILSGLVIWKVSVLVKIDNDLLLILFSSALYSIIYISFAIWRKIISLSGLIATVNSLKNKIL